MTTWDDIIDAVQQALAGPDPAARAALHDLWDRVPQQNAAQRCVLAHYLADQQDALADEIAWDERVLAEFARVRDDDLAPIGIASAAGFAPSLHLNLADGYLRAGRPEDAQRELGAARMSEGLLPGEDYGAMIRSGMDRLQKRVDAQRSR